MVYQSQSNGYVAFKAQSAKGSIASGGSGFVLRTAGGPGGKLTKATYGSNEIRRDGMRSRGRHGQRMTSGSYTVEVSLGNMDALYEAVFQGTRATALTITEATASLASITTSANAIIASAGSWITAGLRVGDVVRLTNHSTAANNSRNIRLTGVTALTLTTAETLIVDSTPDTAFTVTRPGQKLICPAAGAAVKTYFTVEEYDGDLDKTEVFYDVIFHSLKFSMQPDSIVVCELGWTGTGAMTPLTGASAPTFTSPTESTGVPLACVDATLRYGSADVVDMTSWDLTIDRGGVAPKVVGSVYAPDVFTGNMAVGMNFGMLRQDYTKMDDFLAETALTFSVLAVENESEPKDFLSLWVPNFTLGGVDKSPLSKEAGPRTQSVTVPVDLVGKDTQGGAFDATMVSLSVSNT
jgi:hypothetical protein